MTATGTFFNNRKDSSLHWEDLLFDSESAPNIAETIDLARFTSIDSISCMFK